MPTTARNLRKHSTTRPLYMPQGEVAESQLNDAATGHARKVDYFTLWQQVATWGS